MLILEHDEFGQVAIMQKKIIRTTETDRLADFSANGACGNHNLGRKCTIVVSEPSSTATKKAKPKYQGESKCKLFKTEGS